MLNINVTTQQGTEYTVTMTEVWQAVELERDLGLTWTQIEKSIDDGSLDVTLQVIHSLAKAQGKTDIKTLKAWVKTEYKDFTYGVDDDPKVSTVEESRTES